MSGQRTAGFPTDAGEEGAVEWALRQLADPGVRVPASAGDLRSRLPQSSGLYTWWADDVACALLGEALGEPLGPLIYAGQAGATGGATLRRRVWGQHVRGPVGSSTFRRTLAALLAGPLNLVAVSPRRLEKDSQADLTAWVMAHLSVSWCEVARDDLLAMEAAVLHALDPPLNLQGMALTGARRRLRELRRRSASSA